MLLQFIKSRAVLILALLIFIVAKVPHLTYAFYWDESWVYAPAAMLMYAHGPSLLPNAISTDYSKGHPLFFPASCATWMNIFGTSHMAMHSFALFISVLLVIASHEVMLRLFSPTVAAISIILLLCNTFFFVNSSAVLADILIALLAFLTLYSYAREKHLLTGLFLTLLLFTKESGIVACAVIGIDLIRLLISRTISTKIWLFKALSLAIPCICLLAFFVLQKQLVGWYLFPSHTSAIRIELPNTLYNVQRTMVQFFFSSGICYVHYVLLAACITAAIHRRNMRYLYPLLLAVVIYLMIMVFSWKDAIFHAFAFSAAITSGWLLWRPWPQFSPLQQRFLKLITAFALLYIYFCCVNFYEGRYLFPALFMLLIVIMAVFMGHLVSRSVRGTLPVIMACIIAVGIYNLSDREGEMSNFDRMDVQQDLVNYFENNRLYDASIATTAFLEQIHLQDPKTGFLRSAHSFSHVSSTIDTSARFIIFDNIEPDDHYNIISNAPQYSLVHRFSKGHAWVEVFKRR